jgi:hypothetical protein
MSIQSVKPYFKTMLAQAGYTNEWAEAYQFEDIPATRRDKAFHILLGDAFGQKQNQTDLEIIIPVGVTIFFKAGRVEEDGRLASMVAAEAVIKRVCAPQNRVTQASDGIKDVRLSSFEAVPLSDDQDNITRLNMSFEVLYILDFVEP